MFRIEKDTKFYRSCAVCGCRTGKSIKWENGVEVEIPVCDQCKTFISNDYMESKVNEIRAGIPNRIPDWGTVKEGKTA